MFTRVLVAALTAVVPRAAVGQYFITTKRVDDGATQHRAEVALRVSQATNDVIVSWMQFVSGSVIHVQYNVSTDGVSFGSPELIPLPSGSDLRSGDPMVVFTADGTGHGGSVANGPPPRFFWLAEKPPGDPQASVAVPVVEDPFTVDKGVLVAGPPPGGGTDLLAIVYAGRYASFCYEWRLRSMVSPPFLSSLPVGPEAAGNQVLNCPPPLPGNKGGPNGAMILRHSPSNPTLVGRWGVAQHWPMSATELRPRATWSDNGVLWQNSVDPADARKPGEEETEPILWFSHTAQQLPEHGPFVLNTPSIASDPRDERIIYMAFLGRTAGSSSGNNIDLFVAKSTDGGRNFSGDPAQLEDPGDRVLRLRDVEDLHDEPGAIQFMPAITVDNGGGVNLVYYTAWPDASSLPEVWKFQVKYARIGEYNSTFPHPFVSSVALTPAFEMASAPVTSTIDNRQFLGDYIMADSRGCEVWAGYVSRHEGGATAAYVSTINLCIDSDTDRDGSLTSADPLLYADYYIAGDPRADLDRNGQIQATDFTRFLASYSCGCNP